MRCFLWTSSLAGTRQPIMTNRYREVKRVHRLDIRKSVCNDLLNSTSHINPHFSYIIIKVDNNISANSSLFSNSRNTDFANLCIITHNKPILNQSDNYEKNNTINLSVFRVHGISTCSKYCFRKRPKRIWN